MKKWILPLGGVVLLGALGVTAEYWLPPLLTFAEAEADALSGLVSLVQLVLWIGGAVLLLFTLRDRLPGSEKPDEPQAPQDLDPPTRTYLSFLIERYRYLDFRGMGVADRVPLRLPLVEMYVPLHARVEMPEGDTHERRKARLAGRGLSPEEIEAVGEHLAGRRPVLALLEDHDGLVVLGDPGAGKSTFLKWLALKLATGRGDELGLGDRLPFLLPLSAYATALAESGSEPSLVHFIAAYAKRLGLDLPIGPILHQALEEGRALILLDGLDEVRQQDRRLEVVRRVQDLYALHRGVGNKFVMSSRIVGYKEVRPNAEGLVEGTLLDFEDEEIEAFVGKWTAALERAATGQGQVAALDAEREREELLHAVRNHPGVRGLAANPLLLTILALMKRQGVELPERRVELYHKYVEVLLKHWNLARSLDPTAKKRERPVDVLETLRILAPLALWMQEKSPGVGLVKEVEMQDRLEGIFDDRKDPDPEVAARRFVEDLRNHSGLLLDRGGHQFGFLHLTFQEYLAAWALADRAQEDVGKLVDALSARLGDPEWREVSLLAVGCLGVIQQRDRSASTVVERLISKAPGDPGEALVLVADAVADIGAVGVTPETRGQVVDELLQAMRHDEAITPRYRAAAGARLARLGDPRFSDELWYLPDDPMLGFVEVPAGPFLMGSDPKQDKLADEDEQPQHELELPGFFIGRFPVTVAQWRAFVEASGHEPEDPDSLRGAATAPVSDVSWYEALAYCRWLGKRLGELAGERLELARAEAARRFWGGLSRNELRITLPSEAEWEKAARGPERRIYPWNGAADANKANTGETKLGGLSPVGCFRGGASPYGCEEMSGNVWEWTRSLWGEDWESPSFRYPYDPRDGRENLEAAENVRRVLRGGAFFSHQWAARCAVRDGNDPQNPYRHDGFRVVCAPFLKSL